MGISLDELVVLREQLHAEKEYVLTDALRDYLRRHDCLVKDTKGGQEVLWCNEVQFREWQKKEVTASEYERSWVNSQLAQMGRKAITWQEWETDKFVTF